MGHSVRVIADMLNCSLDWDLFSFADTVASHSELHLNKIIILIRNHTLSSVKLCAKNKFVLRLKM